MNKTKKQIHMTPDEFIATNERVFGRKQSVWRTMFLKLTGFKASAITRYVNGSVPIPLHIANLLMSVETMQYYGDDIFDTLELGEEQA